MDIRSETQTVVLSILFLIVITVTPFFTMYVVIDEIVLIVTILTVATSVFVCISRVE